MDRRRRGVVAMGAAVVLAVVGELTSHVAAVAATCAAAATLLLLGGGIAVALSFREEAGGLPSRSRLAMLAIAAGRRPRSRARPSGRAGQTRAGGGEGRLVAYAHLFNAELEICSRLLGGSPSSQEVEAARERLVGFVASPLYGDATRRGLVDEERVREVSGRLARAL